MRNEMREKDCLYVKKISYQKRKRQELKRKFVFSVMTALFVIVFTGSVFSMNAKANSSKGADDYKYYANYCIVPGDTLWNIAEANIDYDHYSSVKEYAKEIQQINKINGEHITNGTYIMLPYYSDELK
ncbi:MAG: LysM peptidoglycan-binding domain-containing protein [Lachnospiraceae bacterium]